MEIKLTVDDKEMKVEPVALIYMVDGKDISELIISIKNKKDRDYLFTHFIREKIRRSKNG